MEINFTSKNSNFYSTFISLKIIQKTFNKNFRKNYQIAIAEVANSGHKNRILAISIEVFFRSAS